MKIPDLPVLSTNAPATNALTSAKGTNALAHRGSGKKETNSTSKVEAEKGMTNAVSTNQTTELSACATTNASNSMTAPIAVKEELAGTNAPPMEPKGTKSTNSAVADSGKKDTNAMSRSRSSFSSMRSSFGQDSGPKPPEVSPLILARMEKIIQSELLGPVMRPMPMGLLGIAGPDAFLRAASGQTGTIKEGESLGDIKLLRIGTNRVLIEHEGQKKELMIFSGFGGESLLPKQQETPK